MQDMVGVNLKYLGIYYIAYLIVIQLFILLCVFWNTLDSVLENFLKNIAIKQLFKLSALFCIIFFQDSIFLYQKYPSHFLFNYYLFFLPNYKVFARKVFANLIDENINQNILIYIILPHLG